jgi:hypothetical protein
MVPIELVWSIASAEATGHISVDGRRKGERCGAFPFVLIRTIQGVTLCTLSHQTSIRTGVS